MPVTITVEDGTGRADANSYVNLADADALLALDPFVTNWPGAMDADLRSKYLIKASAMIDGYFDFAGRRTFREQALAWPRAGAYDSDRVLIEETAMPAVLKKAAATLASLIVGANPETVAETRGLKRVKADTVEVEFDKSDRAPTLPDQIAVMLRPLGGRADGGTRKLIRT